MEFTGPISELSASEAYDLLVGVIVPRPVVIVSTCDPEGIPNVAPFSFIAPGGTQPLSLVLSITLDQTGARKQTLENIVAVGEFVVNCLDREQFEGLWAAQSGGRQNAQLTTSSQVRPPRFGECLVAFECKLHEVIAHGDQPGSAHYVIGEVVAAHGAASRPVPMVGRLDGRGYLDLEGLKRFDIG